MQYRKFGKTDLLVSEIGFGAWAIGGNAMVGNVPIGWGPSDDTVSIKAIRTALDRGINFFDTADFYGLGHSESLLGKEINKRKDVIIATKVGHRIRDEKIYYDYTYEHIIKACTASLKRLRRNEIDYYQLHSARIEHLEKEDCIAAMEQLKQEGKIRYWGLSLLTFKPGPEATFMMTRKKGDGFQAVFNIINQMVLPYLKEAGSNGYGIIARMPLQFGLLTGGFTKDRTFGADDHRHFRVGDIFQTSKRILEEKVWSLCNKYGISKTSLALSFALSQPEVSTVIPGIRTMQQAIQNTTGIIAMEKADVDYLLSLFESDWLPIVGEMEKSG